MSVIDKNAMGVVLGNGRYYADRSKMYSGTVDFGWPKLLLQLRLEYTDGSSFLLVKNTASQRPAVNLADPKAADAIADSICAQWRDAPYVRQEALGYFADMLGYLGFKGPAERVKKRKNQMLKSAP